MMRLTGLMAALLIAAPGLAEGVGPPVPPTPKQTPAEQAIAHAHRDDPLPLAPAVTCRNAKGEVSTACGVKEGARPPSQPCRRKNGEIVVCAVTGRSADRIPLPDERGRLAHPGEFAKPDVGQGPFPPRPGITVARFGMGKKARTRNATLKLIYAQEAAKQAAADAAAAAKQGTVAASPPPARPE